MLQDNTELKKLILENPDLPLLFFATDEANSGNWSSELASARIYKGICLDCPKDMPIPNDERVYTDESDFEEDLAEGLHDEYFNLSEDEYEALVKAHMEEYKPYWKECIIIIVDRY